MNPFVTGEDSSLSRFTSVQPATVVNVPTHDAGDDVGHEVDVKPFTYEQSLSAHVRVGQRGDVAIPEEGDTVYVGFRENEDAVVLGTKYSDEDTIPAFEPGERVIGHPASDTHVRFRTDGSLLVSGANGNEIELTVDGDVVVNDGSTRPLVDASLETSTDVDGHVTDVSVSVSRATDVYVPS